MGEQLMDDAELVKLVFKKQSLEGKKPNEIAQDLDISEYKVKQILRRADQFLSDYDKVEIHEYILDSVEENKKELEKIRTELWEIIKKSKVTGADGTRLVALRELKGLIEIALKRLGELKTNLTQINTQTINIQEMNVIVSKIRERIWEENKAIDEEGVIILKEPKPEVMDEYQKWKRKKKVVVNENI